MTVINTPASSFFFFFLKDILSFACLLWRVTANSLSDQKQPGALTILVLSYLTQKIDDNTLDRKETEFTYFA